MRALLADQAGATAVEFALIAPIMLTIVMGTMEFGYAQYMRAVLEGAMQQAGRNSSLQKAATSQSSIDTNVLQQVQNVFPGATITFSRKNYSTFSDVQTPEDFTDANANGRYDTGECFIDENDNRIWDSDVSKSGQGGANDVVLYTATMTYNSTLPVTAFGLSPMREIKATTTLRNQPYSSQSSRNAVQVCA